MNEQIEYDKKHEFLIELAEKIETNLAKKNFTLEVY